MANLARLEAAAGSSRSATRQRPLLVSVRSGARASMPGMMDTVLNLGPQRQDGRGARALDQERALRVGLLPALHHDLRRRGARHRAPRLRRAARRAPRPRAGAKTDADVPAAGRCGSWSRSSRSSSRTRTGQPFPQDPHEQLRLADQRRLRLVVRQEGGGLPAHPPPARRLGHRGDRDGDGLRQSRGRPPAPGVCFTRDPSSGERRFFGEFLVNAQGEDVVAGIRTPEPLDALKQRMPEVYDELVAIKDRLERHYRDMQDIEFTVQEGTALHPADALGQAHRRPRRCASRWRWSQRRRLHRPATPRCLRVEPASLHQLLVKTVDPSATYTAIARGLRRHARRGGGQGRLRPREGGGDGAPGGGGHPGARGDLAGGRGRHARGAGHR